MISVFTPTHDTRYLQDAYEGLCAQTDQDWRWTLLYNGGAKQVGFSDRRVLEVSTDDKSSFVGALKAKACEAAPGDILLELDHDDILRPTAIAEARKAFEDESVGFVYSNPLICNMDWSLRPRYRGNWKYRQTEHDGRVLDEPVTPEATPASVSRIWFAPDHFRAFRRDVYESVGGHDAGMRVLDDQDLMCRLYTKTNFKHIDQGLYVYRVHDKNCWIQHNKEIQSNVMRLYDKYIEGMALSWAAKNGLAALDLGGRMASKPGYTTVDRKDADIVCDLDGDWPFRDSSVGVIRAMDVFEHLKDQIHTMKECSRVLAPGGMVLMQVPSTNGLGAFSDPTHKSFWNILSFDYYTKAQKARYIDTPVRFQATRLYETERNPEGVVWVIAHLLNLKDGYSPPGEILI